MLVWFLVRLSFIAAGVALLVVFATPGISLGQWATPVFLLAALLILGGLLTLAAPVLKRGQSWIGGRGMPDLECVPTGGPSPDIRLVIKNRDRRGQFHASAAVVASRNDPNAIRQGSYALMWLGRGASTVTLERGQKESLLIARWFMHDIPQWRMGEVSIIECNGSEERGWETFRWNVNPNEKLPEFDIDISIVGVGWSKPFERSYTLRPSSWIGPLELISRSQAAS